MSSGRSISFVESEYPEAGRLRKEDVAGRRFYSIALYFPSSLYPLIADVHEELTRDVFLMGLTACRPINCVEVPGYCIVQVDWGKVLDADGWFELSNGVRIYIKYA